MNKLLPPAITLLAGCVIGCGVAHGAADTDARSASAAHSAQDDAASTPRAFFPQFFAPDEPGAKPVTTVRSFSTQGLDGAVLKGERGTARVGGDTVELKGGTVYVNGISYGAVTPAQVVKYTVTRDKRTLQVDGQVRSPVR